MVINNCCFFRTLSNQNMRPTIIANTFFSLGFGRNCKLNSYHFDKCIDKKWLKFIKRIKIVWFSNKKINSDFFLFIQNFLRIHCVFIVLIFCGYFNFLIKTTQPVKKCLEYYFHFYATFYCSIFLFLISFIILGFHNLLLF